MSLSPVLTLSVLVSGCLGRRCRARAASDAEGGRNIIGRRRPGTSGGMSEVATGRMGGGGFWPVADGKMAVGQACVEPWSGG
jgi:hypothetical protein